MELKKLSLSITAAFSALVMSVNAFANDLEDNLTHGGEVNLFTKQSLKTTQAPNVQNQHLSQLTALAENTASSITPVCPTLSTGALYTLTDIQQGTNPCYHFEVTKQSKTTAILTNQAEGTNIDLSIIRHNPDDTFSLVGNSNTAGNADEVVKALTEPGHYYWFMTATEANNSSVSFGASVATQLDAYEFNDTVATSTILSDKQHVISGNMDASNDIDYFQFTAVRGQDVIIRLNDKQLDEWILEIFNSGWVPLNPRSDVSLSNLPANQVINARVRPNPNLPVNPVNKYELIIGSKVTAISNTSVSGESNVNRVTFAGFREAGLDYATTQAYRTVTWGVTLLDSTGQPVEGAQADLVIGTSNVEIHSEKSNSAGVVSGTVNLGTCSGGGPLRHVEYSFGYRNTWETYLDYGVWRMEIPNTGDADLGIGGDNVPFVTLGHLCRQRLVESVKS